MAAPLAAHTAASAAASAHASASGRGVSGGGGHRERRVGRQALDQAQLLERGKQLQDDGPEGAQPVGWGGGRGGKCHRRHGCTLAGKGGEGEQGGQGESVAGAGALYRESGRQGEKKRTRKTPADEPRGWPGEASGRRGGSKGGGATSVDWGATRSDELRCRPYFTAPCPPPHPLRRPALRNARRTQRGPYPRQAGAEGGAAGSPCCKREVTPLPQRRRRAGAKGHRGRRACRPERPLHAARWGPDPTRRVTPQCSLLQGLRGRDVLPLADVHPPQTAPAGTCRSIVPNQPAKVRQPIPNQPAKGMLHQTEGGGESAAVCSHSPPSPGLPGHPTRLIRDTWSDVTDHHHRSRTFPIEKTTMRDGKISNVFDVDGTETSRVCFSFIHATHPA